MNETLVRKYISVIRRACDMIEAELGSSAVASLMDELQPARSAASPASPAVSHEQQELRVKGEPSLAEEQHRQARRQHAAALMAIDCWPEAVPAYVAGVEPSDRDKINRSNAILDMTLDKGLDGLRVLDFGCGDGWVAAEVVRRGAAETWAFDKTPHADWERHQQVKFTTELGELPPASFHVVLLYDVLDHCEDPVQAMRSVKSLLAPGGTVYVRNHPWCSKHASHLPRLGLNKAFIHLFLGWDELKELGYEPPFTRMETNFNEAYAWWFHEFQVVSARGWTEPVSDFFHTPSFMQLVIDQQKLEGERRVKFFEDMSTKFVDFRLCLDMGSK